MVNVPLIVLGIVNAVVDASSQKTYSFIDKLSKDWILVV